MTSRIPSIDGLRAIAVIAVVLGHYFPNIFRGGYLGVDVFFVISGHVITNSLIDLRNKGGLIHFLNTFYAKRIRRILPSLFIMTVFTLATITVFLTNPKTEIFQTAKYSLIGISNIYLFHISSDYFGLKNSMNPFMHTWSLGIEEQFYFLFPFLVYFIRNKRKFIFTLMLL